MGLRRRITEDKHLGIVKNVHRKLATDSTHTEDVRCYVVRKFNEAHVMKANILRLRCLVIYTKFKKKRRRKRVSFAKCVLSASSVIWWTYL